MLNDFRFIRHSEKLINENVSSIEKINTGYNRDVYLINNRYVLKVCKDFHKEESAKKEIDFLNSFNFSFAPKILYSDLSKKEFPFIYHVESKVSGELLMYKWSTLDKTSKRVVLEQMKQILMHIHGIKVEDSHKDIEKKLIEEFENFLVILIQNKMLSSNQIQYLNEIKDVAASLFKDSIPKLIHGDIHFNNIIIDEDNIIHLIDYERIKSHFVEREFDSINRMCRNPKSFISAVDSNNVITTTFSDIMPFFKNNMDECNSELFEDRLLFFDILNSLHWYYRYPNYDLYNDILFIRSRKLLK